MTQILTFHTLIPASKTQTLASETLILISMVQIPPSNTQIFVSETQILTNGQISSDLQKFVPFWASALLPP